jgi:tetratricopeptide (TPR) repeat protein
MNLADASNRIGAYAEAAEALRKVATACRRVGHRWMEGYALANLGYALTMLGQPDEALAALHDASAIAQRTGEARLAAWARVYRARALLAAGHAEDASMEAKLAVHETEQLGVEALRVLALSALARARLAIGQPARALVYSEHAMNVRDQLGSIEEDEAEVFLVHADALEANGKVAEAADVRMRGRSRITYIARRIADADMRAQFLTDVPSNRALSGGEGGT